MRHHNLRGSQPTSSHLQKNPNFNLLKWHHHSIQQSSIYKTQKIWPQTMSHALPLATRMFVDHLRHFTPSHAPIRPPTRLHDALRAHTHPSSSMTSWWRHFPLLAWPGSLEPTRIGDPVRIAWEKKLWPNLTLTLTKKSKFSKMACFTQFFEYIPILRSISSFEARKLCKLSNS